MKCISKLILLAALSFGFLFGGNIYAGEWLSKKEVTNLLSGNTVKGFYMKQGASTAYERKVGI